MAKTVGQGSVELSYPSSPPNLVEFTSAPVSQAAKYLETTGDILRRRAKGAIYRWTVVLQAEEVLHDPSQRPLKRLHGLTWCTAGAPTLEYP